MSPGAAVSTPATSKGDYFWLRSFVAGGKFDQFEAPELLVAANTVLEPLLLQVQEDKCSLGWEISKG